MGVPQVCESGFGRNLELQCTECAGVGASTALMVFGGLVFVLVVFFLTKFQVLPHYRVKFMKRRKANLKVGARPVPVHDQSVTRRCTLTFDLCVCLTCRWRSCTFSITRSSR